MKKNIIYILILLLIITGCSSKKEDNVENIENNEDPYVEPVIEPKPEPEPEPVVEEYKDLNNTPIAIYRNGQKVTDFSTSVSIGKDIAIFRTYLSNDDYLNTSDSYGIAFKKIWDQYNSNNKIHLGYNLKYTLNDGTNVSQNILHLQDTFAYEGYILLFLYDDYDITANNKIFNHIEQESENTLMSSIKLYPQSAYKDINSKIVLTVFTYDGEDDFDDNHEYRGNSKYSITICDTNKTC